MAVIQEFSVTPNGTVSVTACPRFTITAKVYENDGALVADMTGAASLSFPAVLKTLSPADAADLAQVVAEWLVRKKSGR